MAGGARGAGVFEPGGEAGGIELAGGEGEGLKHGLFFGGVEDPAVYFQKQSRSHQTGTLVAIEKWVVFDDAVGVAGGKIKYGRGFVVVKLDGTRERGIEQAFVAKAIQSSKAGEQFAVKREAVLFLNPNGIVHLASSRKALR